MHLEINRKVGGFESFLCLQFLYGDVSLVSRIWKSTRQILRCASDG